MLRGACIFILPSLCSTACDTARDEALEVRIYGEEYIEEGLPVEIFVDGWSLRYDKFLVSVGGVAVAEKGSEPGLREPAFQVFDLTRASDGAGQEVASELVSLGRYDDTSFTIAPAADATAGNASAEDLALMVDGGFSVYVAGTATKGDVSKHFAWGFATHTDYSECESLADVRGGQPAVVQLTIHGDHLLYDDLYSKTPNVTFTLVAEADADNDGEVSQAELEAVDLRPLPNYQVGSTDIVDLWHFIEHLTTTLGHIDGEGHCKGTRTS
ncbi:hypothetical protein [Nannocystis sp.]|nr:hypothetical protein [Nannocystis sp.]MBK7829112.1 hypothetical protein [Nannocystis sp.]